MDTNANMDNGLSGEVEALARALDGENEQGTVVLDRAQVRLLRALLDRSAADQMLITALQRRLKRYTEAGGEIEAEVGNKVPQ